MTSLCQLRSVVVLLSVSGMAALTGPAAAAHRQPDVKYDLPLAFEANRGQTDAEVKFLSRGRGYMLFLSSTEAVLSLRPSAVLRMRFLGADGRAKIAGVDELPGKSNYFIGRDPAAWRLGVPSYAGVRYEAVYPGVDLLFHGSGQHELEYDFVIGPGADAGIIRLGFEGASRLELDDAGNLVLHTPGGPVIERAPVAYQEIDGTRHAVAARFEIEGKREVAFRVGAYDRERPLVIDPVLSYSTYLGGSGLDRGFDVEVDALGSAYVTGLTCSTNFPTVNALQASLAGESSCDAFVAKFSPSGNALEYSTYLGGTTAFAADQGLAIAVDASGSAYVAGQACSNDFPTVNPVQGAKAGGCDAFVAKLSPDGSALEYSTYLGGSVQDFGQGVAVDASRNAYVTGFTFSTNFPTVNAMQGTFSGTTSSDAFVAKLTAEGSALAYSTYLGGTDLDSATGIAVDASGSAYVVGVTFSTNFPVRNARQGTKAGFSDAFLTRFSPAGHTLDYSTYLGGNCSSGGAGVAVDASGSAHVTGSTCSTDFPTVNAFQPVRAGSGGFADLFVTKFSPAGGSLAYSTYLGGTSSEVGRGIALDRAGNAYVTGWTFSTDFPTVHAVQGSNAGPYDAVVAKLSPPGNALAYSSYLGGTDDDLRSTGGSGIAVDASGNAYVVGTTFSNNFPTVNAFQAFRRGSDDGFLFKLGADAPAQCSNGADDADPEDELRDAADAGCHTDGDPDNPDSYDPDDDDETDVCGDRILHPAEQCDDGNTEDGDGCSPTCRFENHTPDCRGAAASPSIVWSPNHEFVPVTITGLTDPDGDAVSVTVDAITQDEPVLGPGTGAICPDATGAGTASPAVRAERSGNDGGADGRVYHIAFTGRDPAGAACSGVATVCVPHDQQAGSTCVDQGPLHDSTQCR